MYHFEKAGYDIAHMSEEERKELSEVAITEGITSQAAIDAEEHYRKITVADSISETPQDNGSCYQFNETFVEMRTPFDEMRGGFTIGAGLPSVGFLAIAIIFPYMTITTLLAGQSREGAPLDLPSVSILVIANIVFFGFLKYAINKYKELVWPWLNLEAFVQRRILVRFNRKTRMVYLHRPKYAGGIVALPWDEAIIQVNPDAPEHHGIGGYVSLCWAKGTSGLDYEESTAIGHKTKNSTELNNLWEFIRRYMEDGPDAVPKPKLISKFPWPWVSLQAPMIYLWPLFGKYGYEKLLPVFVLLSPLFLIHGIFHWISLLLCWEPKWPKEIEDAGK